MGRTKQADRASRKVNFKVNIPAELLEKVDAKRAKANRVETLQPPRAQVILAAIEAGLPLL